MSETAPLKTACKLDRVTLSPDSTDAHQRPYLSLEFVESGTGHIDKSGLATNGQAGSSTTFAFDSRHVLYGKLRPYLNKVALPDFEGRCTTELIPLLPNEGVDRDYLAWFLRRPQTVTAAMSGKTGSRMPRANMPHLMELPIPLPPFAEQRAIARRLTQAMEQVSIARAAANARLAAAEALPAAALAHALTASGSPEWGAVPLLDLSEGKGTYGTSAKASPDSDGLPVLRMGNIVDGGIDWSDLKYISLPATEAKKYDLRPGDLLFNRTNSAELVGKTAVFDGTREAIFASYLVRFRLRSDLADPRYVCEVINGPLGRQYVYEHMGRAIGQVNVSASVMHKMPVPLPPLPEQRRLMDHHYRVRAQAQQIIADCRSQITAVDALPAALLREAFDD